MIILKEKKDCVGCSACEQICPKHCITMITDEEGFLYPSIDRNLCVDCHLCEKVCPVLNDLEYEKNEPIAVGGYNKNEDIRRQSSSGGFFTLLAEYVINQGGVVFGARWNENWEVVHDYAETIDGLAAFRGSKYVQSRVGDQFTKVKHFLKQGRLVLFTGTPCQIKSLKLFLRKEYDHLICADIICHGTPSPLVWSKYLDEFFINRSEITQISFRDKTRSWKHYSLLIKGKNCFFSQEQKDNLYMRGFLRDLYLRPSCYACPAKAGKSGSDVTLADFWGIQSIDESLDDDKGTSLLIIHSDKISKVVSQANVVTKKFPLDVALESNPSYSHSVTQPKNRQRFFDLLNQEKPVSVSVTICTKISLLTKIKYKFKFLARRILKR